MTSKIVIAIRHAESLGNAGQPTRTPELNSLSLRGKAQAEHFASIVTAPPELFVVSAYDRTRQTLEPVRKRFCTVPVETWDCIHENCCLPPGKYANTTQAQRRIPRDRYWDRCNPEHCEGEGAESFTMFATRVEHTIRRLREHRAQSIFLFTHEMFLLCMRFLHPRTGFHPFASLDHAAKVQLMREFCGYKGANSIPNCAAYDLSQYL